MKHPDAWPRLAAAARRSSAERDPSAPYGFATRVAALGLSARRESVPVFSLGFSLRAFAAACLIALATAGYSYTELVKFSHGTPPASGHAFVLPKMGPVPAKAAPAATDAPASNPTSDDPVAELVNIVS
jgi:hypothetical protein